MGTPRPNCVRCGCLHEIHQHLRDGEDCGWCGRDVCPAYVGAPGLARDLLAALRALLRREARRPPT